MPHRRGHPGLWATAGDFMLVDNISLSDKCGVRRCLTLPYLKSGPSLFVVKLLALTGTLLALAAQESVSG